MANVRRNGEMLAVERGHEPFLPLEKVIFQVVKLLHYS